MLPALAQLALAQVPPFDTALSKQVAVGARRLQQAASQQRDNLASTCIWQEGNSQLLRLSEDDGHKPAILLVPSLVNGAEILDLSPHHSLARFLNKNGFTPYLLDWGTLGGEEQRFTLQNYQRRLDSAWQTKRFPAVLGYCMGCCLSLELARQQPAIQKLALLAPPYNFQHMATLQERQQLQQAWPWLESVIAKHGYLPAKVLQYLFVARNPQAVAERYARFAGAIDDDTLRIQAQLDGWLNQGRDVAPVVAKTSLYDWYIRQKPSITGLQDVQVATLVVMAAYDTIVPPAASEGLLDELPNATSQVINTSHLGLVASLKSLHWWENITEWLALSC